jgi:hypothetical protein
LEPLDVTDCARGDRSDVDVIQKFVRFARSNGDRVNVDDVSQFDSTSRR